MPTSIPTSIPDDEPETGAPEAEARHAVGRQGAVLAGNRLQVAQVEAHAGALAEQSDGAAAEAESEEILVEGKDVGNVLGPRLYECKTADEVRTQRLARHRQRRRHDQVASHGGHAARFD